MCDSYVVMPNVSSTHATMLGKNSDRPAFDCQPLAYHGRKAAGKGEQIELAYVTLDQVSERFATLGSSPYWCWGYEEGYNEYGVAIGNEAVYTKDLKENTALEENGQPVDRGILGMELIRLGLERGKTAKEALDIMTQLVEAYGQWGSGVPMSDTVSGSYNNSYIIADKKQAWILETAGKKWAARLVEKGFAAISNEVSIRTDITCHNEDLIDHAIEKGWWPEEKRNAFDFAAAYINYDNPLQLSHIRAQRIRQLLKQAVDEQGRVSPEWMKRILRDHYEDTFLEGPYFNAALPDFLTVCMHSSPAGFTWGNTASSSITILPDDENRIPVMWWAPVVPCCSIFIPVFVDAAGLPDCLTTAGTFGKRQCAPSDVDREDTSAKGSFWWEIRDLLDTIKGDEIGSCFEQRQKMVRSLFDDLETKWMLEFSVVEAEAVALKKAGNTEALSAVLSQFTQKCVDEAREAVRKAQEIITIIQA